MDTKPSSSTPSGEQVTSSKSKPAQTPSFRSVRFEMSAIFTIILGTILIIFSGVIYWILSTTVYTELDYDVKFQAKEISDNIELYLKAKKNEPGSFQYALETTITKDRPQQRWWTTAFDRRWQKKVEQQDLSNVYINFTSLDGRSLQTSKNVDGELLEVLKKHVRVPPADKDDFYNVNHKNKIIRMSNHLFNAPDNTSYVMQVGISQEPTIQLLQDWMNKVLWSIPIILLLTSFMGGVLANRILRPVEKIAVLAENITQEDLSKRVESEHFYKEMDTVVDSFNEMISRLQKSFNHIRNFSSHIAHELKTPLTIMRGETELALMSERTTAEYQETLKTNLEEIQIMLRIIDDLLFFSRMEHHPGWFKFEKIDFLAYLSDIRDQSSILAERKHITINYTLPKNTKVMINADPLHLRRLFFNLLDNAIKFSPENGKIDLTVSVEEPHVIVRVRDYGRGISKNDADKIFDIFYSTDNTSAGNGLGLSIAQAVAKAHSGIITIAEKTSQGSQGSSQGAEFIVTLPTVKS